MSLIRVVLYLWTSPNTAVGLLFAPLGLIGGQVRIVGGVIEINSPVIAWLLRYCTLLKGGASAITLGHVVLGADSAALNRTRRHERVHVRQYERWGPFFLPAYLLASLFILLRGGQPYLDNPFEKEAYSID